MNLSHPRVLQMVMDSLRYWATAFNVDGFRFDLGVTLGREGHGFDPGSGFFDAIRQDPILNTRKMISEPWDIGPDGYQVGNHPPGFAEWNDKFRDGVRRFWRGDAGVRPDLAARLTGSAELFHRRFRKPWASVNFVASRDGFTLADLVAYEHKHNEANNEDNNDGQDQYRVDTDLARHARRNHARQNARSGAISPRHPSARKGLPVPCLDLSGGGQSLRQSVRRCAAIGTRSFGPWRPRNWHMSARPRRH